MKATLEFALPDDEYSYRNAVVADDLRATIEEINRTIRLRLKHGDLSDAARQQLEDIQSLIPAGRSL